MPFNFRSQPPRRPAAHSTLADCSASVADDIVRAEKIDRQTLWPTLRIRACFWLDARSPRTKLR